MEYADHFLLPVSFLKRLTVQAVDQFIADLKDSVKEAKVAPSGTGTMVSLYGMLKSILFGFY